MLEVEASEIELASSDQEAPAAANKEASKEPFAVGEKVVLTEEDEDVAPGSVGIVLGYVDGFVEVDFPEVRFPAVVFFGVPFLCSV